MGFFEQILAQRQMRLLAIPGAAFRRAQVGDHFLKLLEARHAAERGQVKRRQVLDLFAAVDLVERQRLDHARRASRRRESA